MMTDNDACFVQLMFILYYIRNTHGDGIIPIIY